MNKVTESPQPFAILVIALLFASGPRAQASSTLSAIDIDSNVLDENIPLSLNDKQTIRSRIDLTTTKLAGKSFHAIDPSSNVVKLNRDNVNAAIQPNTMIVERTGETAKSRQVNGVQAMQLPLKFSYIRDDGSVFSFRPDVRVLRPMRFREDAGLFEAVLGFGVIDESNPGSAETLKTPVPFTLASPADRVDPRQFSISHLSQPFEEVVLQARNPAKEVLVDVITTASENVDEIAIPAVRPRLSVSVSPSDGIDGFGLATAVVNVSAEGGGAFRGKTISLNSSTGRFNTDRVTLDSSGNAHAKLRSSFVGTSAVTASGYPFEDGSTRITFTWPVTFSIAALIGALAGAWLRRRRESAGFTSGLIYGLVGGVAGSLGVNFLNLPVEIPAGEAFIFVVTFFSAYLGSEVFTPT